MTGGGGRGSSACTCYLGAVVCLNTGARHVCARRCNPPMASGVPDAEVMAREDVLGIGSPGAPTVGLTPIVPRLPALPPSAWLPTAVGLPTPCVRAHRHRC